MLRVKREAVARALTSAMKAHSRHPTLRVFVEDDATLRAALLRIGGKVALDVPRMEGDEARVVLGSIVWPPTSLRCCRNESRQTSVSATNRRQAGPSARLA